MIIQAAKFRKDGFYSQPFAFGGEEGPEKFDPGVRYRGSLQNYLIDTGDEVILVDTGLPAGTPEEKPDETSPAYTGKDICSYMEAFAALGYKPEQVAKILLTHKHAGRFRRVYGYRYSARDAARRRTGRDVCAGSVLADGQDKTYLSQPPADGAERPCAYLAGKAGTRALRPQL